MSINWVMLAPSANPPYTPLPNEQTLFTSPPRIGLSLSTSTPAAGKQQPPFSLAHPGGILYLTNRRIIYLPDKPTDKLKSFAAPILNIHDSHVTAPFFGPNVWTALLQPVQGGGLPTTSTGVVELKLTFKEGGAFDFHTRYERVRERLHQAVEVSRIDVGGPESSRAAMGNVDVSQVNLDDLPAYEEHTDAPLLSPVAAAVRAAQHTEAAPPPQEQHSSQPSRPQNASSAPVEPPPGYEETQLAGLQDATEQTRP